MQKSEKKKQDINCENRTSISSNAVMEMEWKHRTAWEAKVTVMLDSGHKNRV